MEEVVKGRSPHLRQPFLLVLGTIENPLTYNLIVDEEIIPCGSDCTSAFQTLFASFYVFRLNFPKYLEGFYSFFAECVFKVSSLKTSPSNQAYANDLRTAESFVPVAS